MRGNLLLLVTVLLSMAVDGFAADSAPRTRRPPNIIFMLVDDMGWTDVGCFGSKFYETPNIDRLAARGMKFTDAYSACTVCSPTRASILTGQYPARLHITDWIAGHVRPKAKLTVPDWTMHLPPETFNIARALKSAGYATASIGKWHLGKQAFWPDKQGFDLNVAGCEIGQPPSYFAPYKISTLPEGPAGEFLSDRLTDEAVKFIKSNQDRPFFLYFPHYAVHTPLMAKQNVVAKYKAKADPTAPQHNAVYAGLVESVDDSIGKLTAVLDELKIADNTIIIFTSDNGGWAPNTSNLPLRAGKGSAYEGGVRVPLIVHWPGVTTPGTVNHTPVISVDFFPTLLATAGVHVEASNVVDGHSIEPLLRGSEAANPHPIYWHYPHYHPGGATPYGAVRDGDWRLVEFYEDSRIELYNLHDDISKAHDLAALKPEKAGDLRKKLHDWRQAVGAQMPTANPNYDPKDPQGKPKTPARQHAETEEIRRIMEES